MPGSTPGPVDLNLWDSAFSTRLSIGILKLQTSTAGYNPYLGQFLLCSTEKDGVLERLPYKEYNFEFLAGGESSIFKFTLEAERGKCRFLIMWTGLLGCASKKPEREV